MLKDKQEIDKRWFKKKNKNKHNSIHYKLKSQIIDAHWHWVGFALSADTPTDKQVV